MPQVSREEICGVPRVKHQVNRFMDHEPGLRDSNLFARKVFLWIGDSQFKEMHSQGCDKVIGKGTMKTFIEQVEYQAMTKS